MSNAPCIVVALDKRGVCGSPTNTSTSTKYKISIWIITFFVYTSYHLSRKPITVVKNALHNNCSTPVSMVVGNESSIYQIPLNKSCDSSWAPFDKDATYDDYFGALDVAYLAAYAVGMFISGHVAERMNMRYFLAGGMTMSALLTIAFGLGHVFKIHSLAYFIVIQVCCGIFQSSGWPGVVATMGNWFGKGKRGLIMGVWNAHTSLGNILGGLIASAFLKEYYVDKGYWFWSFFYPGLIIFGMAVIVFFFLVPHPEDVGLPSSNKRISAQVPERAPLINDTTTDDDEEYNTDMPGVDTSINSAPSDHEPAKAVSFLGALKVPGVVEFSLCLFFAKLVSYTFLYWLPQYIKQEMTTHMVLKDPDTTSGDLATLVDVGGIFGAIAAGLVADLTKSSALTCAVWLVFSIPMMLLYRLFGALSMTNAYVLLLLTGFMVNGPYSLITTAVSADLGTHSSLASSAKALATVTAIIDGTGSIGAALGPGITAMIEGLNQPLKQRMDIVFGMLIGSSVAALLLLSRLIYKEIQVLIAKRRQPQLLE